MAIQLPLGLGLREEVSFENFISHGNEQLIDSLVTTHPKDKIMYLWGGESVGKTHLLHAWCKQQSERGLSVAFLPLAQYEELAPDMCHGLETLDAVCIDDIDAISGQSDWEEALFHLYNRLRDVGKLVLISATTAPSCLSIELADLVSRLNAALVFHVTALSDSEKARVLKLRASERGLVLSDEVTQYLMRHLPRDMAALVAVLDTLDKASLAAQRKLTIPFVKQVLQSE